MPKQVKVIVYKDNPKLLAPLQEVVIPCSTQNLFFAQVRYHLERSAYTSNAEALIAVGLLEAYSLLTGESEADVWKHYLFSDFGGKATDKKTKLLLSEMKKLKKIS